MDRFIARENVKHYRRELENGVHEPTRTKMLKLLVEEENHLGLTREQLTKLNRHIARLSEIGAARGVDGRASIQWPIFRTGGDGARDLQSSDGGLHSASANDYRRTGGRKSA
jgi:hypothetical protein